MGHKSLSKWLESQGLSNGMQICCKLSYKYKIYNTGHWIFEYIPYNRKENSSPICDIECRLLIIVVSIDYK